MSPEACRSAAEDDCRFGTKSRRGAEHGDKVRSGAALHRGLGFVPPRQSAESAGACRLRAWPSQKREAKGLLLIRPSFFLQQRMPPLR